MKAMDPAPSLERKRSSWYILTLLLPALVTEVAQTSAPQAKASIVFSVHRVGSAAAQPYLPLVGAPGLRFAEVIPPPVAAVRPFEGGPARAVSESSADVVKKPALGTSFATPEHMTPLASKPDVIPPNQPALRDTEENRPTAMLPDDAAPQVKPEDFLPFFEFPGAGGKSGRDAAANASASSQEAQPRSSATYKEQ